MSTRKKPVNMTLSKKDLVRLDTIARNHGISEGRSATVRYIIERFPIALAYRKISDARRDNAEKVLDNFQCGHYENIAAFIIDLRDALDLDAEEFHNV